MLDGCTEVDPVQLSAEKLKKILPKRDLLRLYQNFKRNRPWFRNNVELVSWGGANALSQILMFKEMRVIDIFLNSPFWKIVQTNLVNGKLRI